MYVVSGNNAIQDSAGRITLWERLNDASTQKRVSQNIDKCPDREGEAFIITHDAELVFHTGKVNIAGWVIRKKVEYGLYLFEFYVARKGWLYKCNSKGPFENLTIDEIGKELCSWKGYTEQIYRDIAKQYASMPRYEGGNYSSREEFEQHARDRLVILGEYIAEINKAVFLQGDDYHGKKYLTDLNRNSDMMRSFIDGKLPVLNDIEHLTTVPIEDIVRVQKFMKGQSYCHLSYANADTAEKKIANALFESVVDLKVNLPRLTYKRRYFDDARYADHIRPVKNLIAFMSRYDAHFNRERCINFIHGRDPYSFTQMAANMQKFYLLYRKKRLAYAAYICSEKVKPIQQDVP